MSSSAVRGLGALAVCLLFVQVACDSTFETPIDEMRNKRVTLDYNPFRSGGELEAVLQADGCPALLPGSAATLNGRPVSLDLGMHREPQRASDDQGACIFPRVLADLRDVTTPVLELKIFDASQTIAITINDYHPFPFVPGALASKTFHPGDRVTLPTPMTADMPDKIVALFNARHDPGFSPSWMVPAVFADGNVSFSIPADAVIDNGQLVVCGGYSLETKFGTCVNATCELQMVTGGGSLSRNDCGLYDDVWIEKTPA